MSRQLSFLLPLVAVALTACEHPTAPVADAISPPAFSISAGAIGVETQITTDPLGQWRPAISGDRIVYVGEQSGNYDIYLYDLITSTETQITTDPGFESVPAIAGDWIVWIFGHPGGKVDIYAQNVATAVRKKIAGSRLGFWGADISGQRVVWEEKRSGYPSGMMDVSMYDLAADTEVRITADSTRHQWLPDISDERIVWADRRYGSYDIYLIDLATGVEKRITTNPVLQWHPAISGDRVVWEDYRSGFANIYMYDLVTETETQITSDPSFQGRPDISGDLIVWLDGRNPSRDVYLYNLATDTEVAITNDAYHQTYPKVSGNRIVWEDGRSLHYDIFMFTLFTPTETLQHLTDFVLALHLPQGLEMSLVAPLSAALITLTHDVPATMMQLDVFIRNVRAGVARGLTQEQADELVARAEYVRNTLAAGL